MINGRWNLLCNNGFSFFIDCYLSSVIIPNPIFQRQTKYEKTKNRKIIYA